VTLSKRGTSYGGWTVPADINLHQDSVVYSAGVGEDISFDLELLSEYHCNILLIDPTPRALVHFKEIKSFYSSKTWKFTGGIQKDYKRHIENLTVDFSKIEYIKKALWDKEESLKFYEPPNKNWVSCSLIPRMGGASYYTVNAISIRELMSRQGDDHIDLLKLDIEGAELRVLNSMLDDSIYPTYICAEFDLKIKGKDREGLTEPTIQRLEQEGYEQLINDKLNITFHHERR
jgi:FkbM family methyltransferase